MFVGIVVSNLDAIAYHLEQGIDNGGITKEALALFLRSVARDLEVEDSRKDESLKQIGLLEEL